MRDPAQAGLFNGGQTPSPEMLRLIEAVAARSARTGAQDRWVPTRLIVHNYWLYSYQEFHFADGKLVLRGQNGAGKSTVLATAIPALLDGDKSPARMDTFGTRSKTVADYLVGPKEATPADVRYYADRTGYVALEFRRGTLSPQYRTIGMGLRAERKTDLAQPRLSSWYFVVTDGRRCGRQHDVEFSRVEAGQEIMRSMRDLDDVLGPANLVTDNQGEYQSEVNGRVFGFPEVRDLQSLTQLLVTLRTPKLDKSITPEKACEMLSDALPPLNPALLGRMTTLIDDIENTQRRVAETEDHLARAMALNREQAAIYRHQAHLAALTLLEKLQEREKAQADLARTHSDLADNATRREAADAAVARLKREEAEARGTLRFIRNHTLYKAADSLRMKKEQLDRLGEEKRKAERAEAAALGGVDRAERGLADLQHTWKRRLGAVSVATTELIALLRTARWPVAQAAAESLAATMADATTDARLPGFNFQVQDDEAAERLRLIDEVLRLLRLAAQAEREYEQAVSRSEERRADFDRADRARTEAATQLRRARSVAVEAVRSWQREAAVLDPNPVLIDEVEEGIVQYTDGTSDPLATLAGLRAAAMEKRTVLSHRTEELRNCARTARGAATEKGAELDAWRAQDRHVSPPARPGQEAFREALAAAGISAEPLYAACDVADGVDAAGAARLEEALEQAGLLDAVIVAAADLDAVRAIAARGPTDWADRWIAPHPVEEPSLTDLLVPVSATLEAADVMAALRSIASSPGGSVRFGFDGTWRIGPLEGSALDTGRTAPRYIGESNRRRSWEETLRTLEAEHERLLQEAVNAEREAADAASDLAALDAELRVVEQLAAWNALRVAALTLAQRAALLEDAQERMDDAAAAADRQRLVWQDRLRDVRVAATDLPDATGLGLGSVEEMRQHTLDARRRFRTLAADFANLEADRARIPHAAGLLEEARLAHDEARRAFEERAREVGEAGAEYNAIRLALREQGLDQLLEREGDLERRMGEIPDEIEPLSQEIGSLGTVRKTLEAQVTSIEDALRRHVVTLGEAEAGLGVALGAYPTLEPFLRAMEEGSAIDVARDLLKAREADDFPAMRRRITEQRNDARTALHKAWNPEMRAALATYGPQEGYDSGDEIFHLTFHSVMNEPGRHTLNSLVAVLQRVREDHRIMVLEKEDELYKEFLFGDITAAIRTAIEEAVASHRYINDLLATRPISDGWILSLDWSEKKADRKAKDAPAGGYAEIVRLLRLDPAALRPDQMRVVKDFLKSEVARLRREEQEGRTETTFAEALEAVLDYRRWFSYSIWVSERGEPAYELNSARYGKTSGAEKALAVFLPLLAAADARYRNARPDAPKLLGMDEAFNGVDSVNTQKAWSFMSDLGFSWIMTSEKLWGIGPSLRGCSTYQFLKRDNVAVVSLWLWDGARQINDGSIPPAAAGDGTPAVAVIA